MRSGGSLLSMMAMLVATMPSARAASCVLAPQGDGRVGEIVDARTFRFDDGNEVQLAGIETIADSGRARAALAALIVGRDVTLTGDSDTPDRYGRQPAFVALGSGPSVQAALVAQGMALVAGTVTDRACAEELASAEGAARRARRGVWAQPGVIKNAESPGEVLAGLGRFAVVEGRILSVREAGGVTLHQFRPALDTGLCCDYFKAHGGCGRGRRDTAQEPGKTTDSRPRVGRATRRPTDRGAPGGAVGSGR